MLTLTRLSARRKTFPRDTDGPKPIPDFRSTRIFLFFPSITIWDTFIIITKKTVTTVVGLCPAVGFCLITDLVTSFERMLLVTSQSTDPAKRTTCRTTSPWVVVEFSPWTIPIERNRFARIPGIVVGHTTIRSRVRY